ncbi:MAG TPA: diaminopimelate epimerase [Acidimicrobiales bacterium]|nr:diaminopimelate epimerase [Acidimicrobiales bacterium]
MRLTKHHGLGNDFLVLLDAAGDGSVTPDRVRALCERRRGVGADGFVRATRPRPADVGPDDGAVAVMELTNADGSPAEMSGNGIRCLAKALLAAGWAAGPAVPIRTAAGLRTVTAHERVDEATQVFSVDMGAVALGDEAPEWAGGPLRRARLVDMGNPHLVVELAPGHTGAVDRDTAEVHLVELGEAVDAKVPGGANVHLLAIEGSGVAIRSYERGVGLTEACGTGACASAAAAHAWGLVGERVPVRMPGGTAEVALGGTVVLRGPATTVATVEVP